MAGLEGTTLTPVSGRTSPIVRSGRVTQPRLPFILTGNDRRDPVVGVGVSRLLKRAIGRFTRGLGDVRAGVASAVDRTVGGFLRVTSTRANRRAETIGACAWRASTPTT